MQTTPKPGLTLGGRTALGRWAWTENLGTLNFTTALLSHFTRRIPVICRPSWPPLSPTLSLAHSKTRRAVLGQTLVQTGFQEPAALPLGPWPLLAFPPLLSVPDTSDSLCLCTLVRNGSVSLPESLRGDWRKEESITPLHTTGNGFLPPLGLSVLPRPSLLRSHQGLPCGPLSPAHAQACWLLPVSPAQEQHESSSWPCHLHVP